jgi:serine/threonine-protein kinase
MADPSSPESTERERRLEEILAAYLAAEDAGEAPEPEALITRFPDLADELRAFFQELDRIRSLAAPLRAVAGAAGDPADLTEPEVRPTHPASPQPVGIATETTHALKTTVELTPPSADDPDATAEVALDAPPARDVLDGGTRIRYFGDYELLKVLGRGGMGVVYKARQLSLNRPVALKMLQAGTLASEDDLRRFQNEAEAVAQLDHPHIVPILEVGRYEEQRYFTMKLIGGPSLDRKLAEYSADPKGAARLVQMVAEAVHHAHQRGILHRDLKPGNILLDERGEPHVTDFGLAKRVQGDSELTQSGAILGTPAYMAPEQASGKRGMVTTVTDVYGLGAILYALLTCRAPFGGDSPVETLEQVRERTPEPPSKRNPRVPRDLAIIALKCLEKDPARRYASAEALADDLRRYLDGESILARPVGLTTRAWMWCKRNPALARLGLALMLVTPIAAFGGNRRRGHRGGEAPRGGPPQGGRDVFHHGPERRG